LFFIYQEPPDWAELLAYFRGSELQNYFTKILEDDLKALIKPQYVDKIPKVAKGLVQEMLEKNATNSNIEETLDLLGNYN
jgi:ATP-binding cassette subfamily E protein 1